MLTRGLCLLSLAAGCTLFLTGAWPGSLARTTEVSVAAFVPQSIPLDADVVGESADAVELVTKAIERCDPDQVRWLTTTIRQTMHTKLSQFIAEGTLHCGPHHCARLDLKVGPGSRMLLISDGRVLARVQEAGSAKPTSNVQPLPDNDASKSSVLAAEGCGGPAALLRNILPNLKDATLATGMLDKLPVIRIRATLKSKAPVREAGLVTDPTACEIFLHAQTLWPVRVDWLTQDNDRPARISLRIEFLNPTLNHELDAETCDRLFSYQPDDAPTAHLAERNLPSPRP